MDKERREGGRGEQKTKISIPICEVVYHEAKFIVGSSFLYSYATTFDDNRITKDMLMDLNKVQYGVSA